MGPRCCSGSMAGGRWESREGIRVSSALGLRQDERSIEGHCLGGLKQVDLRALSASPGRGSSASGPSYPFVHMISTLLSCAWGTWGRPGSQGLLSVWRGVALAY